VFVKGLAHHAERQHGGSTSPPTAVTARMLSGAGSVRVTLAYAVTLIGVSVTLTALGRHAREVAVSQMSTNLHNLAHGRVTTLVGSAFVDNGGAVVVWSPGLVCLLVSAELIWRSRGLLIAFAVGHVGATLIVAAGLVAAIEAGWLPRSVAHASDVGMSYGAVGVLGALTAAIPSRWRPAWAGWWIGTAVGAALVADFTGVGHIVALLLGMGLSVRLPSTTRWTPVHVALLTVGATFGYFVLAGPSVSAPVGGLAGALCAGLAGKVVDGHRRAPFLNSTSVDVHAQPQSVWLHNIGRLIRIAIRNVPEMRQAVHNLPSAQGVKDAIANFMGQTALPRSSAGRVVGHSVRLACPECLSLVP
jgi:hypothetical protein